MSGEEKERYTIREIAVMMKEITPESAPNEVKAALARFRREMDSKGIISTSSNKQYVWTKDLVANIPEYAHVLLMSRLGDT